MDQIDAFARNLSQFSFN